MYIKKKNKQHKLSHKYNVSEILNSTNKTKKAYEARKHNLQVQKHKQLKKHKQEGGFPKLGKDPFDNSYDVAKGVESFDVANKEQYNRLKKDIRNTIFYSWINKKTGATTPIGYEILKRLLKANLFFARMKLENAKMLYNLDKLIRDKNSGIKTVQTIIDEIFELQRQITDFYEPNKEGLEKQGIFSSIKKIFTKKNNSIKDLIHKQDKLRMKLMEYTMFTDSKDLSSKCDYTMTGFIGSITGKERSYKTTKKIICLLGKYRKNEGKFNRYYNLFHRQYEKFVAAFPPCENTVKESTLFVLDITIDKKLNSIFENVKCDKEKIAKIFDDATNKALSASEKQLPNDKLQKKINKDKEISEDYKKKGVKFKELIKSFNDRLVIFKNVFSAAELYGIHHYKANIPKNKKLFKAFRSEDPLLKTNKLAKLAKDPDFKKKFISIIVDLEKRSKPIFEATRTITGEVIPNIKVYNNILEDLKILSINIDNINNIDKSKKLANYDTLPKIDINEFINSACTNEEDNEYIAPDIICIQNGTSDIATNKKKIKIRSDDYIPISYSYHSGNKYNIILINNNIIIDNKIIKDDVNIGGLDQSTYFILNYKPDGMTIPEVQKSFAAINLVASNQTMLKSTRKTSKAVMFTGGGIEDDCEEEFTGNLAKYEDIKDFDSYPHKLKIWKDEIQELLNKYKTYKSDNPIYVAEYNESEIVPENADSLKNCFIILGYILLFNSLNVSYELEQLNDYNEEEIKGIKLSFEEIKKNVDEKKIEKLINVYINYSVDFDKTAYKRSYNKDVSIINSTYTNETKNLSGKRSENKRMVSGRERSLSTNIFDQILLFKMGKDILNFIKTRQIETYNYDYDSSDIYTIYDIDFTDTIQLQNFLKNKLRNNFNDENKKKQAVKYIVDEIMIKKEKLKYFSCKGDEEEASASAEAEKEDDDEEEDEEEEGTEGETKGETEGEKAVSQAEQKDRNENTINNNEKLKKCDKYKSEREKVYNHLNEKYPGSNFTDESFYITKNNNNQNQNKLEMYMYNIKNAKDYIYDLYRAVSKLNEKLHQKLKFTYTFGNNSKTNTIDKKISQDYQKFEKNFDKIKEEYIKISEKPNISDEDIENFKSHNDNFKTLYYKIMKEFIDNNKFDDNEEYKNMIDGYNPNALKSATGGGVIGKGITSKCLPYITYYIVIGMLECYKHKLEEDSKDENDPEYFYDRDLQIINTKADISGLNPNIEFEYKKFLKRYKDLLDPYNTDKKNLNIDDYILEHTPVGRTPFPIPPASTGIPAPDTSLKGITIVTTELIGSNPEKDLATHILDINNFKIDKAISSKGLREAQINGIFETIEKYAGRSPDILCGDFGAVYDETTINITTLYNEVKKYIKNNDQITSTDIEEVLKTFYTNGMSKLSDYSYNPNLIHYPDIKETKTIDKIITNYIFYKNANPLDPDIGPVNTTKIDDNFGGILPIGARLEFTVSDLSELPKIAPQFIRKKPDTHKQTDLYTEKELKDILSVLDELMGNFGYGYKPFLKRDLGCLSFNDDSIYGTRKFNDNTEILQTFYTMNFPSFIETYLYQLSGFFNNASSENEKKYYNENQLTMSKRDGYNYSAKYSLNLFKKIKDELGIGMDIIVRLLLIPSAHLKLISGIDVLEGNNAVTDYRQLSQMFCTQYYRDIAQDSLEKRITEIMKTDDKFNFLSKLKEQNADGNLANLIDSKVSYELITTLFEFIFIMLKLKYIDKQLERFDISSGSISGSSSSSSSGSNGSNGRRSSSSSSASVAFGKLRASSDIPKVGIATETFLSLHDQYNEMNEMLKTANEASQKIIQNAIDKLEEKINAKITAGNPIDTITYMEEQLAKAQKYLLTLTGESKIKMKNEIQELQAKIALKKLFGKEASAEASVETPPTKSYTFNVLTYNVYSNAIKMQNKGDINLSETCKNDKCINNIVGKIVNTEKNTFRDFPTPLEYDFIALQESSDEHVKLLQKIKGSDATKYNNLQAEVSPTKDFIDNYFSNNSIIDETQNSNIVTYYDKDKYELDADNNNILQGILNLDESRGLYTNKIIIRPILFLFLTNKKTGNQVCVINLWNKHNKDDDGNNIEINSLDFSDSENGLPGRPPAPHKTQIINLQHLIENYVQEKKADGYRLLYSPLSPETRQKIDAFKTKLKDKRRNIILMGDFNANVKKVTIYDRELKINFKSDDPTCCDESLEKPGNITDSKLYIDKIFVSENYDIQNTVGLHSNYASNHLPVLGNITIKSLIIPKIENTQDDNYYQAQSVGLLSCGRNALNNLLGGEYFLYNKGTEVTDENMKFAYGSNSDSKLNLTSLCEYLKTKYPDKTLCQKEENYDIIVLMAALDILGYSCESVEKNAIDNKCSDDESKKFIGYLVNYGGGNHWVAVVKSKDNDNLILKDSLDGDKKALTIQNVKDLAQATHFFKVCFTGQYVVDITSSKPYKDTKLAITDTTKKDLADYKTAKYDILIKNIKVIEDEKFAEIINKLFAAETKEEVDNLITSEIKKYTLSKLSINSGGSLQHNNFTTKPKSKKHKKNTKSNQRKSIQKNHKKSKKRIN